MAQFPILTYGTIVRFGRQRARIFEYIAETPTSGYYLTILLAGPFKGSVREYRTT